MSDETQHPSGGDFDMDGDTLREECGVFGVFGHDDAAALTALGMHALQHRGQEAAGVVSYDGDRFHAERRIGLVGDSFSKASTIERLSGRSALGHVRYSTTGGTILRNVQPMFAELATGGLAIAHNGNITNGLALRHDLIADGAICQSTSDTEVILHLVAHSRKPRIVERYVDALRALEGAFSLIALTNKKMIGARDPHGIRPLVLGELNGAYILASETCALDIIGARFVREVENGEVVVITADGIESLRPFPPMPERLCIFEYVYFSRPDSVLAGRSVYDVRRQMGMQLAAENPVEADVVIPVPDSAAYRRPSAMPRHRAYRSNSASSATTMSAAPSSSRPSKSVPSVSSSSTMPTVPWSPANESSWSMTASCVAPPRSRSFR